MMMITRKRAGLPALVLLWLMAGPALAVVDNGVCSISDLGGGACSGTQLVTTANEEIVSLRKTVPVVLQSVAGTNTITASTSPALLAYQDGNRFRLKPVANNTGAVTLNVNGIGAKSLVSSSGAALVANDLAVTTVYDVTYVASSDHFRVLSPLGQGFAGASSPYVTVGAVPALTGSRAIAVGAGLAGTDGGAGASYTIAVPVNGIGDSLLRQGAATSVIGRAANSIGNVADIAASADGQVLHRAGGTLAFGQVVTADVTANAVTDSLLRQGAATSVIGRSAATAGNVADIAASADNQVLRQAAGVLGFGTLDTASLGSGTLAAARMPALTGDVTTTVGTVATTIAGNAVTNAKAAQMAANTIKGNNTGALANATDLTVAQLNAMINATVAPIFSNITSRPTTLAGYGITDGQPLDSDLTALAGNATAGLWASTAVGAGAARALTAPAAGLTITNPAGTAGNPTFALANDLGAIEGLGSTGFAARTAADTWAQRSVAAGPGVAVSNGDGAAGNPSVALDYSDAGADPALSADQCRFTSNATVGGHIVCEGDTADAFETRIAITDPTADRTFTIPNADSVAVQPLTCGSTDKISAISAAGVITCSADAGGGGGGTPVQINGAASAAANFNDTAPAAPANAINNKWQRAAGSPDSISSYVPYGTGLTASGGNLVLDQAVHGNLQQDVTVEGDISPPQITADQNDYAPTGLATASVLRLSSDNDSWAITGLTGGADGRVLVLINAGSTDIILRDENASSTAANRFSSAGMDTILGKAGTATLVYDATVSRWMVQSRTTDDATRVASRRQPWYAVDFLAVVTWTPFANAAISTGTVALNSTNAGANHPGIIRMTSSTTANSGYSIQTGANSLRLGGGEAFEAVFLPVNIATTTVRMGFHDSTTSADAVDGAYIEVPTTGAAVCKTASNSVRTTSATIATLSTGTWYRAVITVDPAAGSATCQIFDANGAAVGSQTASGNMPTAAGRETQAGVVVTNSGTTATGLMDLDYMAVRFGDGRPLLR